MSKLRQWLTLPVILIVMTWCLTTWGLARLLPIIPDLVLDDPNIYLPVKPNADGSVSVSTGPRGVMSIARVPQPDHEGLLWFPTSKKNSTNDSQAEVIASAIDLQTGQERHFHTGLRESELEPKLGGEIVVSVAPHLDEQGHRKCMLYRGHKQHRSWFLADSLEGPWQKITCPEQWYSERENAEAPDAPIELGDFLIYRRLAYESPQWFGTMRLMIVNQTTDLVVMDREFDTFDFSIDALFSKLKDGTVVFIFDAGQPPVQPKLQAWSLNESRTLWERTERYEVAYINPNTLILQGLELYALVTATHIELLNLKTGKVQDRLPFPPEVSELYQPMLPVRGPPAPTSVTLQFFPTHDRLAVIFQNLRGSQEMAVIWEVSTHKQVSVIGPGHSVVASWQPGRTDALLYQFDRSGGGGTRIRIVDLVSGQITRDFEGDHMSLGNDWYSSDQRWCVSNQADPLQLWKWKLHAWFNRPVFSEMQESRVFIHDLQNGTFLRPQQEEWMSFFFSSDARWLFGDDRSSGKLSVWRLPLHRPWVTAAGWASLGWGSIFAVGWSIRVLRRRWREKMHQEA